ncbi:DUF916 and DUF3324 domain-containing protein [Enterococcus sp. DIV0212c]|uniref:DUF916 and DUF3324 domain-containing protein n=1 Tax=Enterococcus sp. DIV0212c TaxID=2230867 RepID=UPI001AC8EBE9|nr:DUF916 and DUF3324 domain-containing protein [Enterococcus sp. DIV0212c]MBO1354454.1 DUF916 and DUF3324 domain-containing protein [Enterococcus sp. DIV0212c]
MKKRNILFWICLGIVIVFGMDNTAYAADEKLGYTVSIITPEKQVDPNLQYFYVQTKPNETQTLKVSVQSLQKDPVTVKIFVNNANTSTAGQINYLNKNDIRDSSLKDPLSDIVTVSQPEVTVANLETKVVEFEVTPPKESYSGIKLGAIAFEIVDKDKKVDQTGVSTKFSYKIGLMTTEDGEEYKDSMSLNLMKVSAQMVNGKKTILAKLQNPEPKMLSDFEISSSITKKGDKKVLKSEESKNLNMAPNSNFNYEIDWGMNNLDSGEYTLSMKVKNDFNEWTFKKDFVVSSSTAKDLNDNSVYKLVTPNWLKITTVSLLLIAMLIIVRMFIQQKKWKKQLAKRRIARKKRKKKREETR